MSIQAEPTQHVAPFRFEVCPLRTFLEVPVDGDPRYKSIEIQRLNCDGVHGYSVLLTRVTGEIDFYSDSHLPIDEHWFATDGSTSNVPRGSFERRSFTDHDASTTLSLVEDTSQVTCRLSFIDREGVPVIVEVDTDRATRAPRCPVVIPAPPQFAAFHQLPFLHAGEFWMLSRNDSTIHVAIDNIVRAPSRLAVPLRWKSRYLARFGADISLISFNKQDHPHRTWNTQDSGASRTVSVDEDTVYELVGSAEADGPRHIVEARSSGAITDLRMRFDPPVPAQVAGASQSDVQTGQIRFMFGDEHAGTAQYTLGEVAPGRIRIHGLVQHWLPPTRELGLLGLAAIRWKNRRGSEIEWIEDAPTSDNHGSWATQNGGARHE